LPEPEDRSAVERVRKSRLPFGPWLVVGALPGVLVGGEVAGWFQAASLGAR
jgi:prepilin signal peptidase PulO-like enzyme (type II secretory pathway)